jgi:hypothetical protein
MRNPKHEGMEEADDKAAERLKDFLKRRLPPGVSPEELNPELAEQGTKTDRDEEHPAPQDVRHPSAGKSDGP